MRFVINYCFAQYSSRAGRENGFIPERRTRVHNAMTVINIYLENESAVCVEYYYNIILYYYMYGDFLIFIPRANNRYYIERYLQLVYTYIYIYNIYTAPLAAPTLPQTVLAFFQRVCI
jgi:hypothetical protein